MGVVEKAIPEDIDNILNKNSYDQIVAKRKEIKRQLSIVLLKYNDAHGQEKRKLCLKKKRLKEELRIWGEAEFFSMKMRKK